MELQKEQLVKACGGAYFRNFSLIDKNSISIDKKRKLKNITWFQSYKSIFTILTSRFVPVTVTKRIVRVFFLITAEK